MQDKMRELQAEGMLRKIRALLAEMPEEDVGDEMDEDMGEADALGDMAEDEAPMMAKRGKRYA